MTQASSLARVIALPSMTRFRSFRAIPHPHTQTLSYTHFYTRFSVTLNLGSSICICTNSCDYLIQGESVVEEVVGGLKIETLFHFGHR